MNPRDVVIIHLKSCWAEGSVHARWAPSGRRIIAEVEDQIERAWAAASQVPGKQLFDGPMCRLEGWDARDERVELVLSRTSYKPFFGTNLHDARVADRHGPGVLANPVGLSTALQTSDGWLLLGRRSDSVAYYPARLHPFAGALEPRQDLDVFADVRRELMEELALRDVDIERIELLGLVEDRTLRQPELIFSVRCAPSRAQLERQLDRREHRAVYPIACDADAVSQALAEPQLTPVAVGTLGIWGSRRFSESWFIRHFG